VFLSGLQHQLQQQGLEVSLHHYWPQHSTPTTTTTTTSSSSSSEGSTAPCTNLHAVLRSPRGDGKEALLLVTPLGLPSPQDSTGGALGDCQQQDRVCVGHLFVRRSCRCQELS
jgi:hypothetical protein